MIDCPNCGGYGFVLSPEEKAMVEREDAEWEAACSPYGFIGPMDEPKPLSSYFPEIKVSRGGIKYPTP